MTMDLRSYEAARTNAIPSAEPRPPSVALHMDRVGSCLNRATELVGRLDKIADQVAGAVPREVHPSPTPPKLSGLVAGLGDQADRLQALLGDAEQTICRIESALG